MGFTGRLRLFGDRLGLRKADCARLLCDNFYPLSPDEKAFIWGPSYDAHSWFAQLPSFSVFPNLTMIQLAGDIDYALRDAHYTGRYTHGFDYRYFQTLTDIDAEDCQAEITECVRELYRSIYALNSVYGDPLRRFITLILARLCEFLIDQAYLDVERYRVPSEYLELDDDTFMAHVAAATERATTNGFVWARDMFDSVKQLRPVEIQRLEMTADLETLTIVEIEALLAAELGIEESQRVIALTDTKANVPKYVLFGRTFDCYSSAVESDYFLAMTGGVSATNRTGLWDERYISYVIV